MPSDLLRDIQGKAQKVDTAVNRYNSQVLSLTFMILHIILLCSHPKGLKFTAVHDMKRYDCNRLVAGDVVPISQERSEPRTAMRSQLHPTIV